MIRTKIARIIDPTRLVLAAGTEDGITEGMEFVIYTLSDPIVDPENGQDLGRIELVKGRVVADHVQDRITIARTKSKEVERVIDPFAGFAAGAALFRQIRYKELVTDQLNVEGAVALQEDPIVRVGDAVRSTR